jgi:outer membrane receptor for ferrienterochelin and colicin
MRIFTQFFTVCLLVLATSLTVAAQGVTTASIFGRLADGESSEPLIGATVQAVHTPSGTSYGNITDVDGFYRLPGMRVGGPYIITVTYVGYESIVQDGVYLNLGQAFQFSPKMGTDAVTLSGVEVVSSRSDIFNGNATGAETNVSEEQINALPTVARAVGDYARLTPQATVNEGNDGFSISVGGMNNRYNAFYVDGAVNNDVFGLSGSGFNGGQTGVSPISVDAIESFQINVAPFDVRVAGFAGAAISAITRSGTNNTEASVYAFFRNQQLISTELPDGGAIEPFKAHTEGFRIGGPIMKDKLFYFVNYERQREETPLPFDAGTYIGDSSTDDLLGLGSFLQDEFNYDAGTFTENRRFLNSDKLTVKFDYNINANNKLAFRVGYVGADNLEGVQSNTRTIRFLNSSEQFVAKTYSSSLELNTILGNSMSNSLTLGFTAQRDDRDPAGEPFPRVFIRDGSGGVQFGGEPFSSANLLNQDVLTINNNFEIFKGKHTYTIGANLELYKADNLFIRENYGNYTFNSVADFRDYQNTRPFQFTRSYSLVDNISGDESGAVASFNAGTAGFYVQDKIQVNDKLNVTIGLRADLPFYQDTPENEVFNTGTIPLLEAEGYDLRGARVGDFVKPQILISPRIGFNYDILGDNTAQVRGGIGVFTSRAPLVWVGGAFNNYGQNVGSVFERGNDDVPFFNPDVQTQFPGDIDLSNTPQGGQIDLFAEDFKLPQFLKANIAIDKKLPFGFIGTIDLLFNKTLQNVAYQNLNLRPSTENLEGGPDTRPIFNRRDEIDDTYGRIMLGYNTSEGYAYNITASLQKNFSNGFFANFSWTYGDSYAVFDGTSSQNSSQWRGLNSVGGRNFDQPLTRSDFASGHRLIGSLSYRLNGPNGWGSTFTVFSETRQGSPYSLIYGDGDDIQNEDSSNRALIYIPATASDINLVDANGLTAAEQWSKLDDYLSQNDYTAENRGAYAERNQNFGPWSTVVDFRYLQDLPLGDGTKHKLQLSFDVFNLTNLINKDWGRRQFIGGQSQLIEFEGFEDDAMGNSTNIPTFSFDPDILGDDGDINPFLDDNGIQSSRWQGQVGIRYIFK